MTISDNYTLLLDQLLDKLGTQTLTVLGREASQRLPAVDLES